MKTLKTLTLGLGMVALTATATAQVVKGCPEEYQESMVEAVALYQQDWKHFSENKDNRYLVDAYPYWKAVVAHCPKQSKNLYVRGTSIIKAMLAQAKSEEEKDSLIADLMWMYDVRLATYNEGAKIVAMKAMALEEVKKEAGLQQYYALYDQAVKMGGDLEAAYLVKYMEATINYVRAGYDEPTLVVDNYDLASDRLEEELRKNAADSAKAATIRGYIGSVEAAFAPYANCEQLVSIYTKKFEADPENVELLKKITNILMRKGCSDQQLFFAATENLYRLEPTPTTALRMGTMCVTKKEYGKAIEYLNSAAKGVEEKDLYRTYLLLGMAHSGQKSYAAARSAFLKAAEADGSKGEPYLMIAQLYASSASSAKDDNVNGRSAYWAAVDKAMRAKQVDPTEANVEQANKLINTYSAHFPKQTDAFMAGLENGQTMVVPGWIGESTKVRTR